MTVADTADLDELLGAARACRLCADLPLGPKPLLQCGRSARILIAGQAPGRRTHEKGIPFDDLSGSRLREWLGLGRATFYDPNRVAILPMGLCYPGTGKSGDLPPRRECAPAWRGKILARLPAIELTILIGMHAQRWHLGKDCGHTLTENVSDWRRFWPSAIPLPHPSPRNIGWLKRHPEIEAELLPELRRRVQQLIA